MDRHHLTPGDTETIFIDSLTMTTMWGTVEHGETRTDPATGEVTGWSAIVTDDDDGESVALDHDTLIKAMVAMVAARDTLNLRDSIIDDIRAVLTAGDNDSATDAMVALDCIGFDAITQFALFGKVEYG